MATGRIVFADKTELQGESVGREGWAVGRLMPYTSMTDYQSILCDPACRDQIVCLTYPLIGNVGTVHNSDQDAQITAGAVIVRETIPDVDHWLSVNNLRDWFREQGKVALSGIDTREIIRHLRRSGPQNAVVTTDNGPSTGELAQMASSWAPQALPSATRSRSCPAGGEEKYHLAVLDLGIRHSLVEALTSRGCRLTVLSPESFTGAGAALRADALIISSGSEQAALEANTELLHQLEKQKGKLPILAVDAGFLLLARSYGLQPQAMQLGHNGANYPVRDLTDGKTRMTLQHHHYVINRREAEKLPGCRLTQVNINDGTVEGLQFAPDIAGVQFLPETDNLPHQTGYIWDQLLNSLHQSQG